MLIAGGMSGDRASQAIAEKEVAQDDARFWEKGRQLARGLL
jgi:hypothetical protein